MGLFNIFKKKTEEVENSCEVSFTDKVNTVFSDDLEEEILSIKERVKNAYPSHNGLYPHEILMLEYAHSYKTNDNTFQNFWLWDYSIEKPQELLESLFKRGFLCYSSIEDSVSSITVAELKELLASKEQKTTGKKAELVNRVIESFTNEELEKIFTEKRYALTELGQQEITDNEYVIYCHRKRYITPWEMNVLMHDRKDSNLGYRDILWGEFNKQSLIHAKNMDFGLYRSNRLQMAEFLIEEEKLLDALQFFVEVVAYDLSGLGNNEKCLYDIIYDKELFVDCKMSNFFRDSEKKEVIVPEGIIARIEGLRDIIDMSDDEFIKFVYEISSNIKIHNRIFTEVESANILLSLIGLENRTITNSYNVAIERVKALVK